MKRIALTLDSRLMQVLGTRYVQFTRGPFIHERCCFLRQCLQAVGRVQLRVLDVGCGAGLPLQYFDWFCRDAIGCYTGIDFVAGKGEYRFARVRIPHTFRIIDLDSDWRLGRFDVVICTEVIEHIIDDDRLFAKLAEHVADDGTLVVTSPSNRFVKDLSKAIPGADAVSTTQDGGHVRIGYDLERFQELATNNGMRIVSHTWLHPFNKSDIKRYKRRLKWCQRLGATIPTLLWFAVDYFVRTGHYASQGEPVELAERYWSLGILVRRM